MPEQSITGHADVTGNTTELAGALDGVRILDLSRILAGPWATQLLADLGAEVIKIEQPQRGDDTRRWGPPFLRRSDGTEGEGAYFLAANRNKRSVAIDFSRPQGADLIRAMARDSQVLVENFKVGGLAGYGLDYPSLRALNPALVYCSITGYGQDGPWAARAGYDAAIQAEGGLMSLTGEPDGPAQKTGVAVADLMAGMYASTGILAALRHAEATGEGQHIDLALLDTQVAFLANQAMNALVGDGPPTRHGNAHPNIAPYQTFRAADGEFMLAVGNDTQFQRLCGLLGRPGLAEDPRFAANASRVRNREALLAELCPLLEQRPAAEWLQALETAGIPCAAINTLDQVFAHPQVRARGNPVTLAHPQHPALPLPANPLKLSATPVSYRRAPPLLGADTDSVLGERLGLETQQIAALRANGVIG